MSSRGKNNLNNTTPKIFSSEQIQKTKYAKYFDYLQKNLDRCTRENNILRIINQIRLIDIKASDIEKGLGEIIKLIPEFGFEARRLYLVLREGEKHVAVGAGENVENFKYLDDQILSLLINDERLFINDTGKIHTLKFQQGKEIPKTVLGVSISNLMNGRGVLWFSSKKQVELNKEDVEELAIIKDAVHFSINRLIERHNKDQQINILEAAYYQFPSACLIMNNGKIIMQNAKAETLFDSLSEQEKKKVEEMIQRAAREDVGNVEIGDRGYLIKSSMIRAGACGDCFIIYILDETETYQQRKYLNNILQTIALNIETPLENILGYSKMVPLLAELDNSQSDYIKKIIKEAEECLSNSRDLLALSRFDQESPLILQDHSILGLIEKIIESTKHIMRQKRIGLEKTYIDEKEVVRLDAELFLQAAYLILEYMMANLEVGKSIQISARKEENSCTFIISDTGSGLPELMLTSQNETEYLLSIDRRIRVAYNIMKFHGGTLMAEREIGKGSKFIFYIPQD